MQREVKKPLDREARSAARSPRGAPPASPKRETPAPRASTQHPAPPEARPNWRKSHSSDSVAKVSKDSHARDRASRSRSRSPSRTREERDALKCVPCTLCEDTTLYSRRDLHSRLAAAQSYVELGEAKESDLYVAELRRLRCIPNPRGRLADRDGKAPATAVLGERATKSLLGLQAADAFGDLARWTLSWDSRDDGVFVGGRGSGKGLHVDQVYWSNIGHNWRGKNHRLSSRVRTFS